MSKRPIHPHELDPARSRLEIEPPVASSPPPAPAAPVEPPRRRPALRVFLGAGALLVVGLLGLEAYNFLADLFERNLLLGAGFALLIGLTAAGAGTIALKELRDLMRLGYLARLRGEGLRLLASEVHGEAEPVLAEIRGMWRRREDLAQSLASFERQASDALTDGERLRLFARTVLEPVDRRAYREVVRAARDVGGLTALSPLGILDGLVVLMHTLAMLRRIATLYGFRPGAAGMASLLRRTLRNVLLAGVAEVIGDTAVETLGASLTSVLSAKAGQGIINGLLCARLGLAAMELCRPLPFTDADRPRLKHIRREVFG